MVSDTLESHFFQRDRENLENHARQRRDNARTAAARDLKISRENKPRVAKKQRSTKISVNLRELKRHTENTARQRGNRCRSAAKSGKIDRTYEAANSIAYMYSICKWLSANGIVHRGDNVDTAYSHCTNAHSHGQRHSHGDSAEIRRSTVESEQSRKSAFAIVSAILLSEAKKLVDTAHSMCFACESALTVTKIPQFVRAVLCVAFGSHPLASL